MTAVIAGLLIAVAGGTNAGPVILGLLVAAAGAGWMWLRRVEGD